MSEFGEAITRAGLSYGSVAMHFGVQVVVGLAESFDSIPVTATRDGMRVAVPASELTPVKRPRGVQGCAGCGAVWKVKGDRTSHCSGCHETFEGGVLWDAHRIDLADGKRGCKAAASMIFRGSRLRKVADVVPGLVTVGTWRGPEMAKGQFGGDAA